MSGPERVLINYRKAFGWGIDPVGGHDYSNFADTLYIRADLYATVVRERDGANELLVKRAEHITALLDECEFLRAQLAESPHAVSCSYAQDVRGGYYHPRHCDCSKSRIPRAGE